MAEEKESTSIPLSQAVDPEDPAKAPPISPSSSTRKACGAVLQSWVSKKFMTGWKDVCRLQAAHGAGSGRLQRQDQAPIRRDGGARSRAPPLGWLDLVPPPQYQARLQARGPHQDVGFDD
ncbi:uncharacterized protein LOC121990176 isoform X3 [Zingiber officinale]|uniref:uncharacterized protein LOC121990176 isoform X3 n=1 Tax=Zingiber officinale TaxID=94328 RepID=UPI001C4C574F|nr:uncharacterized protein LOC121990176 isoform X3 [Zingiber officinale]XP_042400311.1 uncharacterized protein LOC121990176 isoform X3 [Zingiber officinale]